MTLPGGRTLTRFLAVGAIGFGADLAAFTLLRLAVPDVAARLLAVALAVTVTWALNRRFTFAASGRPVLSEWLRYNATSAAGAGTNAAVSLALLRVSDGAIGGPLALAAGSVAALAVNYILAKRFAFALRQSS
jgi:putative flippase GtrA